MNTKQLTTRTALGIAFAGSVALLTSTSSFAFDAGDGQLHYYESSQNGSVWSYYPGYVPLTEPGFTAPRSDADAFAAGPSAAHTRAPLHARSPSHLHHR